MNTKIQNTLDENQFERNKYEPLGALTIMRIYKEIDEYTDQDIKEILSREDPDELLYLPLSVGLYHYNWKYAQTICLKLAEHENAKVRANAILGLGHIARTNGQLDKRLVKPILLKELRSNKEHRGTIIDAITDINFFLKWNLASKHNV